MPVYDSFRDVRPTMIALSGLGSTFAERQAIRDQYAAGANALRTLAPNLPESLKAIVSMYLVKVSAVIARGATLTDLNRLKARLSEWNEMLISQAAAEQAATERVAAEYAAEAATERARVKLVTAGQATTAEQVATKRAAAAKQAVSDPLTTESFIAPIKTGLMENPVLIAVAVGAIILLLKK